MVTATMEVESRTCIDAALRTEAQSVVDLLRNAKLSVVTAESCTGGLLAAVLSHCAQASDCLDGGFVVYTKGQKTAALGVSSQLLQSMGAVNAQVARQMVRGALESSPATLAISVTGVIGPDADEDGNPPGLVFLAVGQRGEEPEVVEKHYTQDPEAVRRQVILQALSILESCARRYRTLPTSATQT
jgi:nicotinamide-nucleotide amidase